MILVYSGFVLGMILDLFRVCLRHDSGLFRVCLRHDSGFIQGLSYV
jgi:hypothetical protein